MVGSWGRCPGMQMSCIQPQHHHHHHVRDERLIGLGLFTRTNATQDADDVHTKLTWIVITRQQFSAFAAATLHPGLFSSREKLPEWLSSRF